MRDRNIFNYQITNDHRYWFFRQLEIIMSNYFIKVYYFNRFRHCIVIKMSILFSFFKHQIVSIGISLFLKFGNKKRKKLTKINQRKNFWRYFKNIKNKDDSFKNWEFYFLNIRNFLVNSWFSWRDIEYTLVSQLFWPLALAPMSL